MFKEFKPKKPELKDITFVEIESLFKKGDFKTAYRHCRANNYQLECFSDALVSMGRRLYHSRPGELLSLIHKYGINVGFDIPSILREQLKLKDYHGFLKNVHRFGLLDAFKLEIQDAINNLRRPEEAQSWRVKFKMINSNERMAPSLPQKSPLKPSYVDVIK